MKTRVKLSIAAFTLLATMTLVSRGAAERPDTIHIGIVRSLFHGVSEPVMLAAMQPLCMLVESQCGIKSEVYAHEDALELARQLIEHKRELAVINGVEFGWALERYPNLRAIMLAVNQDQKLQACLVVKADSKSTGFRDLKGKSLAFAEQSRIHCYMYLERQCRLNGQREPSRFFAPLVNAKDAERALDSVVEGAVEGAVVDEIALKCYQRRKPSRVAHLKVIARSEVFPASVVVYEAGVLDAKIVDQLQKGFFNAHKKPLGRELMTIWKVTSFDPVPKGYTRMLHEILKSYPPAENTAIKVSQK
jgi:ABC-type phosphate/phosphonate transport system substrate-binding protein